MTDYMFYNLAGGVDYVSPKLSLEQSAQKLCWQDSKNIEIYKNSGIARVKGNTLLAQVPSTSAIAGLFEYKKGDNSHLVVNTADGNFYKYDGLNFIPKKSGLTPNTNWNYANYLNGVICTNGVDDPFFYEDGVSQEIQPCNATRDNVPIRGLAVAVYKGRLWFGSEGVLYFSALGLYNDWTTADDAGYIANFHNDSSKIVALKAYKSYLAIYKEDQTYLLTGDNPDNFAIVPFADKGSCSPCGLATVENKQYFFDKGIFNLEDIGQLGQIVLSEEVSKKIHSEFENLDYSRLNSFFTIPYEKKHQVWFYFPYNDDNYLKVCWVYSYENDAWFKRVVPQEITCVCAYDGSIFSGTSDGKILVEDSGDTFDGDVIEFFWASPFFHFGQPSVNKTIEGFLLTVDNLYENKFRFYTRKNFSQAMDEDEMLFEISDPTSLLWDANNWDDTSSNALWAVEIELTDRASVTGSNAAFQICVEGSESSHNCAILGFEFQDVILDE